MQPYEHTKLQVITKEPGDHVPRQKEKWLLGTTAIFVSSQANLALEVCLTLNSAGGLVSRVANS